SLRPSESDAMAPQALGYIHISNLATDGLKYQAGKQFSTIQKQIRNIADKYGAHDGWRPHTAAESR
ncbi:hypothetical protein, partial [Mesorhizobium sp. P5_C1]